MYIVYKEPYKSYGVHQEGYFVSYKDKLSDNFSFNWIDSYRYKTLAPALTRLGIYGLECTNIDDFFKQNKINKTELRNIKLKSIINANSDDDLILAVIRSKGRIEKVIENNDNQFPLSIIGCEEEVVNFIKNKIESNNKKVKKMYLSVDSPNDYIDSEEDLDFWNEWVNN
jgi:hypothetical protein